MTLINLVEGTDTGEEFKGKKFDLPNIQRGFIWKASQIENLWDSLLRRFPTGSIISETTKDNKILLLDGQQRTTSIALGFGDLKSTNLRSSSDEIRIFIDMRKPNSKEGRKYAFRVITRSHPWGYQRNDNTKPLEANDKSRALELWDEDDPFKEKILQKIYPFDAIAPLPLNLFTNAVRYGYTKDALKKELLAWVRKVYKDATLETITNWLEYKRGINENEKSDSYSIDHIFDQVRMMWDAYQIPMIPLPSNLFDSSGDLSSFDDSSDKNTNDDENDENEKHDSIEAVFIRLNSAGTPLGGEELNYSLIKSKIEQSLQKKIEQSCDGIMKPSRFISLAYRLYQQQSERKSSDSIDLRVRPRQFQTEMCDIDNKNSFIVFIDKELLSKNKNILEKIKSVLKYGEKDLKGYSESIKDYRLPYPLFIKIASASYGEIMFILLYRIFIKGDYSKFEYGSRCHRHMIAIILLLLWNGKDSRSRYDKLINRIWENVKNDEIDNMWGSSLIQKASVARDDEKEAPLKAIPTKTSLFLNVLKNPRTNTPWEKNINDTDYSDFIYNVMCNRDLLLWTQRDFLSDKTFFDDKLFRLDDTDVPFDWDHISPYDYIKSVNGVPSVFKFIYNTPANLRVWPYKLNRSDQNGAPSIKLDATKNQTIIELLGETVKKNKNYLLDKSFCDKEWLKLKEREKGQKKIDFIIKNRNWINIYNCIFNRWKKIYDAFVSDLEIRDLL
ncbi:MAG: DUF262 domain-containing protein [Betaproteobacteria bacterium]|nr:DUF262 domain-containing protein [Betaproteobacteria bacterium]